MKIAGCLNMVLYKSWKGLQYHSMEKCMITQGRTGFEISSAIAGNYEEKEFSVEYFLIINLHWQTLFVSLSNMINGKESSIAFSSDGHGNWYSGRDLLPEFSGCRDIDISVTPITNSLPVNRLSPTVGEGFTTDILYLDVLERQEKKVLQKYKRLSPDQYRFETVPNDFEAVISFDDDGFVADYPGLFESI